MSRKRQHKERVRAAALLFRQPLLAVGLLFCGVLLHDTTTYFTGSCTSLALLAWERERAFAAAAPPKILYFDAASELRDEPGIPACDLDRPDGPAAAVYELAAAASDHLRLHHTMDQHGSAWYIAQALLHSPHAARFGSPGASAGAGGSQLVYVDVDCYFTLATWASFIPPEQLGRLPFDPQRALLAALGAAARRVGPHRAVYAVPKPHAIGCSDSSPLRRGYMLATEQYASCPPPERTLVIPYNSNQDAPPHGVSYTNRSTLVTFVGGGSPDAHRSAGMKLRAAAVAALAGARHAVVRNSCMTAACGALPHAELAALYRDSVFCLVVAGDTSSSRRATEVALHGCIPVFLGPPFPAAPLSGFLAYSRFAVGVRVRNTSEWAATEANRREVAFFGPPFPPRYAVDDLADVHAVLESMPQHEVGALQSELETVRHAFAYGARLDPERPTASDYVVRQLLQWQAQAG